MNLVRRFFLLAQALFYLALAGCGLSLLAAGVLVVQVSKDLPKLPSPLSRIIDTPQSLVYGSDGRVLANLGERDAVGLSRVSPNFINAVVATEDHRFFEHHGINKLRIIKALYITLFKTGQVQGASTITQQLAKNLFFSFEKTWQRKFKEMLVALQIEASSTKAQILEAYVNQIYFGAGAQGIEKAARVFLGKSAQTLDLAEAALLAGLPKSPTRYNPFHHYENAMARKKVVLERMAAAGFISKSQAEQAAGVRPNLYKGASEGRNGSYFLDALIGQLSDMYGDDVVFHGGIKVYATLDSRFQAVAQDAVRKGLDRLAQLMGPGDTPGAEILQAALVAIDTDSGAVKAMVGGKDYVASQFNRAVNGRRQAGSGFKPFVYYTAFDRFGMSPSTVLIDRPVSIHVAGAPDWRPQNFEKHFRGPVVLKQALVSSVNTVAAQLVAKAGPEAVIRTAQVCGIKSPLDPVYSVALGSSGVTTLDMATGFSTFATLGIAHEPFLFWRVEDAMGRVMFERIVKDHRVLDPVTAFQVVDMMKGVVDHGSGRSVRQLGFTRAAAGKTGTTNDYNDAWFSGFTPSLCASVWVGFDRKQSLRDRHGAGITGGRGAAPIWTYFMAQALEGQPERDFVTPDGIRFETVDVTTGCPVKEGAANNGEDMAAPALTTIEVAVKQGQINCPEEAGASDP